MEIINKTITTKLDLKHETTDTNNLTKVGHNLGMNNFQSTTVETVSDNTRSLTETIPQVCEINPSSSTNEDRSPTENNPRTPPDDNNMMDPIQSTEASNGQSYSDEICLEGEILLETFVDQQISKAGIRTQGCETPR